VPVDCSVADCRLLLIYVTYVPVQLANRSDYNAVVVRHWVNPCQINQTFPPWIFDLAVNLSICLSIIFRKKYQILCRYLENWPSYAILKWGGVRKNLAPISRLALRYHIQMGVTQEIVELETWGLHCCNQQVVCNLIMLLAESWVECGLIKTVANMQSFFSRMIFCSHWAYHIRYTICSWN